MCGSALNVSTNSKMRRKFTRYLSHFESDKDNWCDIRKIRQPSVLVMESKHDYLVTVLSFKKYGVFSPLKLAIPWRGMQYKFRYEI